MCRSARRRPPLARGSRGWHRAHPLGQPLQALGPARLRAGPAHEAPAHKLSGVTRSRVAAPSSRMKKRAAALSMRPAARLQGSKPPFRATWRELTIARQSRANRGRYPRRASVARARRRGARVRNARGRHRRSDLRPRRLRPPSGRAMHTRWCFASARTLALKGLRAKAPGLVHEDGGPE